MSLCNSSSRRRFFTPRGGGSFGTTYSVVLGGNTFLNRVDVAGGVVFREAPDHGRRPLVGVIAHERVHALLERRYGALACSRMPTWKIEGYCEYVGGGTTIDAEEGKRLVRERRRDESGPARYFRHFIMVKYLLDVEGLDVDAVMAREFDEAEVLERVQGSLNRLRP
ncbi:MAG TPA: hypothetical protein VG406_22605 [Isosphaeraceae bacterium]|jgi:hypothetical protein|nr:hypothetical protein [Isosphaeraceae bacterium]